MRLLSRNLLTRNKAKLSSAAFVLEGEGEIERYMYLTNHKGNNVCSDFQSQAGVREVSSSDSVHMARILQTVMD